MPLCGTRGLPIRQADRVRRHAEALVGALPAWGHSASWGYAPSGGIGLILLIVNIFMITGCLLARQAARKRRLTS
jgi:hypothetical protein